MRIWGSMVVGVGLLVSSSTWAQAGLWRGSDLAPATLEEVASSLVPGSVLIISEEHDQKSQHDNQIAVLEALAKSHSNISVGMEFFERPDQAWVDRFVQGEMSEADFLAQIRWKGFAFDFYRSSVLFPASHGGKTLALNATRALTGKVAKQGLDALTHEERALLPQGFELGNAEYRARFQEVMGDHVPPAAVDRYFQAQSIWDETMASTAVDFLRQDPEQVLVILVGDFHAAYGGGLPDRLKRRGVSQVHVISQTRDASEAGPHSRWGVRADWVWVTE